MSAQLLSGPVRTCLGSIRRSPDPVRSGDPIEEGPDRSGRSGPVASSTDQEEIREFLAEIKWTPNYAGELEALLVSYRPNVLRRSMQEYDETERKGATIRNPSGYWMGIVKRIAREDEENRALAALGSEAARQKLMGQAFALVKRRGWAMSSASVSEAIRELLKGA